jgi:nucleoside-diphosphate kinase
MKFTLAIIKPDAVQNGYVGLILDKIISSGFHIRALKMMMFSKKDAQEFYYVHKYRSFFESLVNFMSYHPIVAAVLEKKNAVSDFRLLIGDTNFKKAKEGTIRKSYAKSLKRNAIHGSDSDVSAIREINFCFSSEEIFI